MANTEYKVDETFQFGLKTLKCVEGDGCSECAFFNEVWDPSCLNKIHVEYVGPCVKKDREDRTDVIFIEVEENEIQNSEESIKHTR